jgi:nucleotidyltransferase substrate binding protein (TIGR01987 family)
MAMSLEKLKRAINQLQTGNQQDSGSDLERDGMIQRFEYTFELAWKAGKRFLNFQGINANSPRQVIRELGRIGVIDQVEVWIDFLAKRNIASHCYGQELTDEVHLIIPNFLIEVKKLLEKFELQETL